MSQVYDPGTSPSPHEEHLGSGPFITLFRICGAGMFVSSALSLIGSILDFGNVANPFGGGFSIDLVYFVPGAVAVVAWFFLSNRSGTRK